MQERVYAAIDLKSFYASVECVQRGLDPMKVNLLVADPSRTEKTICLAVSPSLKSYGISGRARLFEALEQVKLANALRREKAPGRQFSGASWDADALARDPSLAIDFITAPPRMKLYMDQSAAVYQVYLKYVAPEHMHVYSVDEVFLELTPYLRASGMSEEAFVRRILRDVLETTGLTATAGIGTNLYLCKIAMDIVAKHAKPDAYGARLARLDERQYRCLLWEHTPLTDFWRVGRGYAERLERLGLYTMGDVARCSIGDDGEFYNEDLLYRTFGIQAQLLIDHAWGWEPCTMADIKAYRPATNSLSSGQVLTCPYSWEKARLITQEMADLLALDLVEKGIVTDKLVLTVGYDAENLKDPAKARSYRGEVVMDAYGRKLPKPSHGTENLPFPTSSGRRITQAMLALYDRVTNPDFLVRRITLTAEHILLRQEEQTQQLSLFCGGEAQQEQLARERRQQQTVLQLKRRFGKNAILKGINFLEGATARSRNKQVGGHKG